MVSLSSPPLSLSLPPPSPSPARRRASPLGFPRPRPPRPQNPERGILRRAPRLRIPDPMPFPRGSRGGLFRNVIETCSQSFLTCCYSADLTWIQIGDNYRAVVSIRSADDSGTAARVVITTEGDHLSALSNMLGDLALAGEMVINGRIRTRGSYLVTVIFLRNLLTRPEPDELQDSNLHTYFRQDEHFQKVYFGKYSNEELVDISANGDRTSVLAMNVPDKSGLLAAIFTVLREWNITVESAEMHTHRRNAVNKFIISCQGLALTKKAAQVLTRELWYRVFMR